MKISGLCVDITGEPELSDTVLVLAGHECGLADTDDGTLRLWRSSDGVRFEADVDDEVADPEDLRRRQLSFTAHCQRDGDVQRLSEIRVVRGPMRRRRCSGGRCR